MMKPALLILSFFATCRIWSQSLEFAQPVRDSSGKYAYRVTDYSYENAYPFNWYDYGIVKQGGKWYIIDYNYEIASPPADSIDVDFFAKEGDYLRAQLLLQNGRWILFDPRKYRHSPQFTAVRKQMFRDDALLVEVADKKTALLDLDRFSLTAPFDSLLPFPPEHTYSVFWGQTGKQVLRIDMRPKKTQVDTFDLVNHLEGRGERFAYRRNGLWNVCHAGRTVSKAGIPDSDFFMMPYADLVLYRHEGKVYVQDMFTYRSTKIGFPSVLPRTEGDDGEGLWNMYVNTDSTRIRFKREKYGFMDLNLNVTIAPQFDDAHSFDGNTHTAAKKDGAWGVIDRSGRFTVPAEYDTLFPLVNNRFAARKNGRYGIIDVQGDLLHPFRFTELRSTVHNYYATADGQTGLVDSYFKEIIPLRYTSLQNLGNGWFQYKKDSLTGVYDTATRTEVFEGKYRRFERNGTFLVHNGTGGRNGLLTPTGRVLIPDTQAVFSYINNGFFRIAKQDYLGEHFYAIYDANTEKMLPGRYNSVGPCGEGMMAVYNGRRYGYINTKGELVLPFRYTYTSMFKDGKALVWRGSKSFYIDMNGQRLPNKKVP